MDGGRLCGVSFFKGSNASPALHTDRDTTATFGSQAKHDLNFAQLALAFAAGLGSDRR